MYIYFATSNEAEAAQRFRACFPSAKLADADLAEAVRLVSDGLVRVNEVHGTQAAILPARELTADERKRVVDVFAALQAKGLSSAV